MNNDYENHVWNYLDVKRVGISVISILIISIAGNFKGKCVCKTISHICKSTTSNFMNKDDQEALLVILCLIGFITVYKFIKKVNIAVV